MPRKKHRVTSVEVAKRAGVSQSAVSRAFTPGSSVSDKTRRKVLQAASALNYVPNSIARSLITARSNIVAMVVGDLANPFYSTVLDEFSQALQARGKHVLVFRVATGSEVDDALMDVLQYQVDGIIVTSAQVSSKMTGLCLDRGIPVVSFNRYIEGSRTDNVCCDNLKGGRLIAGTLLAAGGTRFAMIAGQRDASTNRDRMEGFFRGLRRGGIRKADVRVEPGHYSYEGGFDAALRLFEKRRGMPDALFCTNDVMALGALDALRGKLGLRVPEDVMVIGFDDIPDAARAPYRLSTVRQPREDMIARTLELLERGPGALAAPATALLEGELVLRETLPASAIAP
jgi:DNA-binding LacI/PurR family transcriptional regulator